jgi:cytochrome c-type biogenesis protein CcmH/NrfG
MVFPEFMLNDLGYRLLRADRAMDAVAVFRLNAEAYPGSGNGHDSLAEALLATGDTVAAIASYRRSVELEPANDNAVRRLRELGGRRAR